MTGRRRVMVGVIGGDRQLGPGKEIGALIARHGWILLTGGRLRSAAEVAEEGAVKDASMLGAHEAHPGQARLIGILPGNKCGDRLPDYRPGSRHFFLATELPHYVRNVINGRTPDIAVAFGGGCGTLAEIAFALAAGRPVLFAPRSLDRLRDNLKTKLASVQQERDKYLEKPLRQYPIAVGAAKNGLLSLLEGHLGSQAQGAQDLETELVRAVDGRDWVEIDTGFPGLPAQGDSKKMFEEMVRQISQ